MNERHPAFHERRPEKVASAAIGFVGLGRMGAVMAARLLAAGHPLTVWNRDSCKCEALAGQGAAIAESAQALFAEVQVVFMMSDAAGSQAILSAVGETVRGKLVIPLGTFAPDAIGKLCETIEDAGGRCLEVPVLGTVAPAAEGQLVALAGGKAEDLEQVRPLLEILARLVIHTGPVGTAATMKLAHNLLLSSYWVALGESLSLADAGGLDRATVLEVLSESAAASGAMRVKMPLLAGEPRPAAFDIAGMAREMTAICALADHHGLTLPFAVETRNLAARAVADGKGSLDVAMMAFAARS